MASEDAGEDRDEKRMRGDTGRRRILRQLAGEPVSLADLAAYVERPLADTKRHLDLLAAWGAVVSVGQRKVDDSVDETGDDSDRS